MAKEIKTDEILREYLLRLVSDNNRVISGMMSSAFKSNRQAFAIAFDDIYEAFVSKKNLEWQRIKEDRESVHPSYKPYQYFDIDTLYAYKLYLDKVIEFADKRAYGGGRRLMNAKEFSNGVKDASFWLHDPNIPLEEKGYYNKTSPVSAVWKKGSLSPKKALTGDAFREKCGKYNCEGLLQEYVENKHSKKRPDNSEFEIKADEIITFMYNGNKLTLNVDEKDYFVSRKGEGLTAIKASCPVGVLFGTYMTSGQVYYGDIFDLDGNLVEVNGGGEQFYPTKTQEKIAEEEMLEKKYDSLQDGDQIHLF
ncbi:MAG: hypothetical protein IJW59_00695 [Clostridia bacterium]|nr:hypothetical protein [Clostridia bacterium]